MKLSTLLISSTISLLPFSAIAQNTVTGSQGFFSTAVSALENFLFDVSVTDDNIKGKFSFPVGYGLSGFREFQIWEQPMCDGGGGNATVRFNKQSNRVTLDLDLSGLLYRPDFCFDYNPSTIYNSYPDCVQDGAWQIWVMGRIMTERSIFYYDINTGDLIGNEYDLPGVPANSLAVEMPVLQMIQTRLFESNPQTLRFHGKFEFTYNQMLDDTGSGGAYVAILPMNIYAPVSDLELYYTNTPLPPEAAMTFDDILADIVNGMGAFAIDLSLEPNPKPAFLGVRDNVMIGYGGYFPASFIPPFDPEPATCGSFQHTDPP